MSNVSKSAPVSASAETTFRENPHRGSCLVPFMNSRTGADVVSALSLASRSSAADAAGAAGAAPRLPPSLALSFSASASASAPSRVSASAPFSWNVKNGTALTSKRPTSSSTDSASTRRNRAAGCCAANVASS